MKAINHPFAGASEEKLVTDWSRCVLCQEATDVQLVQPKETGYETLSENLIKLNELKELPFKMTFAIGSNGPQLTDLLKKNQAIWHKVCYVKCNKTQINRIIERKTRSSLESPIPMKRRLRTCIASAEGNNVLTSPSSTKMNDSDLPPCFFCDKSIQLDDPKSHTASTFQFDENIRRMILDMQDASLMAKLPTGDFVAADIVYHKKCCTQLYTDHRSFMRKKSSNESEICNPSKVAFSAVVSYIENSSEDSFKLADLTKRYEVKLREIVGDEEIGRQNSTRLKEALLEAIPDLEVNKSSGGLVISYKAGDTLMDSTNYGSDDFILRRAANIVRESMFKMKYQFDGSLKDEQYSQYPAELLSLVQMILGHEDETPSNATCSITQLMVFNSIKRSKKIRKSDTLRHNIDRETAVPLYVGLLVHNKTRKKELVDKMYDMGLSVSYDRIMQVESQISNAVIQQYENQGIVCPPILEKHLFTTGQLDNLDHDPRATLSKDSFHGTAISITQHPQQDTTLCNGQRLSLKDIPRSRSIQELPEDYTCVKATELPDTEPIPSSCVGPVLPENLQTSLSAANMTWVEKLEKLVANSETDSPCEDISWSAHFASLQKSAPRPAAITSLLPLFRDNAHSVSMVKHGMNLLVKTTEHLNPGQVPVMTLDQPLFAIAKKIQWTWPAYGEDKFVLLMGGLHIEMALLAAIGDFLKGSGWAEMLAEAGVTTEGRAEAVQKGTQTSRAQWAHQVSYAALFVLVIRAYHEENQGKESPPFDSWCAAKAKNHPHFNYWFIALKQEDLFLRFLHSQRNGQYPEYLQSLAESIKAMFEMDHHHYARWLSVHVSDLLNLPNRCPAIHAEFIKGNFVTQKSQQQFSLIPHDQNHEQLNALVKGDGGAIGITENDKALKRWMVAGPEIAHIINDYDARQSTDYRHHEQIPSIQKAFAENVMKLIEVIETRGNPFKERSCDLFSLHSQMIVSDELKRNVESIGNIGKEQYMEFANKKLINPSKGFYESIKRNKLSIFIPPKQPTSKNQSKVTAIKQDALLFSRMYIACQTRGSNLLKFFQHENHPWPPALAEGNVMRTPSSKADLVKCLEPLGAVQSTVPAGIDVTLIDGASVVHSLDPKKVLSSTQNLKTFKDYSGHVFIPHIMERLQFVKRLDIIWDRYIPDSLKSHVRCQRGTSQVYRVNEKTLFPSSISSFLKEDQNKAGLYKFLAEDISTYQDDRMNGKIIITTYEEDVLVNGQCETSSLAPCNHEEADYRLLLHCKDAYDKGHRRMLILASDTDVVAIAVSVASKLQECQLFVRFGQGKNTRYIAAHEVAENLGPDKSSALLFFHAFTGCDQVSMFHGIGKKTAWDTWLEYPEITATFKELATPTHSIQKEQLQKLERYVVLMYSKSSPLNSVNDARLQLFSRSSRQIENIPPTQAALLEHTKRATFQAGHVWAQAIIRRPELPSLAKWGWMKSGSDSSWSPLWSTLPEASKACRELIKCGCRKGCQKGCKCKAVNLPCTQLCQCAGECGK